MNGYALVLRFKNSDIQRFPKEDVLYFMKPKGYEVQPEEEDLPVYDDGNLGAEMSNANTR